VRLQPVSLSAQFQEGEIPYILFARRLLMRRLVRDGRTLQRNGGFMRQGKQGKKARRTRLFVALGLAIIAVVGAILFVPRLIAGSENQTPDTIIAYATATVGDVSTTVAGSGSLAETSTAVDVPIGITITDVYVHAGDIVAAGDVLAAVDADSVSEAIDLVDEEIDALAEALSTLGESTTLDRMVAACEELSSELSEMYAFGYIRASTSGTIGSVNIKKGDTVTANTGSGSGSSGSNGSTGNTSSDSSNSSGSFSFSSLSGFSGSTGSSDLFDSSNSSNSIGAVPLSYATLTSTATGDDGEDINGSGGGDGPVDGQAGYALSALPYVTATVFQAKLACAASVTATREEATRAYLINLCEAKAWSADNPSVSTDISVEAGLFALAKGVYPIVFSSSDDPTVTRTTYVVLEDEAGDSAGGNTGSVGSGSTGDGGTNNGGSASTGSSGITGGSGAGGTAAQDDTTNETVTDSAKVPAFQIRSDDEVEVQIQLDEMDVASVKVGQRASVELSALEDQTFEGTVSSVSISSGSYYAVITIPRTRDMYAGFSATATIVKEQATDVVIIPLDAVQQRGSELFVYTSATETGELGGETIIETGLSDESTVEVISGLSEGVTVYYQQRVTTSVANTGTDSLGGLGGGFGNRSDGGLGGGGQMPDFGGAGGGPVQIPG
jgi:multidrug efflux pump subunit AcrA (membrane-fusion protein)